MIAVKTLKKVIFMSIASSLIHFEYTLDGLAGKNRVILKYFRTFSTNESRTFHLDWRLSF